MFTPEPPTLKVTVPVTTTRPAQVKPPPFLFKNRAFIAGFFKEIMHTKKQAAIRQAFINLR